MGDPGDDGSGSTGGNAIIAPRSSKIASDGLTRVVPEGVPCGAEEEQPRF